MARARSCVVAVYSGAHSPMRACLPFVGIRRHDPAICLEEKSPRVPCARRPGEGTQHGGWAFRSQVASDVTRTCTSRRIVNAPARAFCCYRGLCLPGRSRYGARAICGNRVPVRMTLRSGSSRPRPEDLRSSDGWATEQHAATGEPVATVGAA
jgi:hypothetical protein